LYSNSVIESCYSIFVQIFMVWFINTGKPRAASELSEFKSFDDTIWVAATQRLDERSIYRRIVRIYSVDMLYVRFFVFLVNVSEHEGIQWLRRTSDEKIGNDRSCVDATHFSYPSITAMELSLMLVDAKYHLPMWHSDEIVVQ